MTNKITDLVKKSNLHKVKETQTKRIKILKNFLPKLNGLVKKIYIGTKVPNIENKMEINIMKIKYWKLKHILTQSDVTL